MNGEFANSYAVINNIKYAVAALLTAVLLDKLVGWYKSFCKKSVLWLVPALMAVVFILTKIGHIYSWDGKPIALIFFPYEFFYISRFFYVLVFVLVPVGIDELVAKKDDREHVVFTIFTLITTVLCVACTRIIKPAFICIAFCMIYYWMRSTNKYKFWPVVPLGVAAVFGSVFGIWGVFEPGYIAVLLKRLVTGYVPNELVEGYLLRGENNVDSLHFFANNYPLYAIKGFLGIAGIVLLLALYVVMFVLLWKYVRKFTRDEEKPRAKFLLWTAAVSLIPTLLYECDLWGYTAFSGLPFTYYHCFIWLAVVYYIFSSHKQRYKVNGDMVRFVKWLFGREEDFDDGDV